MLGVQEYNTVRTVHRSITNSSSHKFCWRPNRQDCAQTQQHGLPCPGTRNTLKCALRWRTAKQQGGGDICCGSLLYIPPIARGVKQQFVGLYVENIFFTENTFYRECVRLGVKWQFVGQPAYRKTQDHQNNNNLGGMCVRRRRRSQANLDPKNEVTFLSPISHFFFLPDAMGFLALVAFFFGLLALPWV
jgi:hypothetical protein